MQDAKKASALGWGDNVKPVTADVTSEARYATKYCHMYAAATDTALKFLLE